MCRAHVRCTSVATRVSCIEPPVSTLYTMRGGVASAAPASQRSGCAGKDGSTEGSGVSGIAAGSDGAWSWTSGGVVGMTRCCTGATNKCAASRRPAAATTKRVATARIILVRWSVRRAARAPVADGEGDPTRRSTQLARTHADRAPRLLRAAARSLSALLRSHSAHSIMSTDHGTDVLSGIYVSGDLLEVIVSTLDAKELAIVSKVSKATLHAAQAVASSSARALAESLGCVDRKLAAWSPGAATERRLRCLREWELTEEHNLWHLRADKHQTYSIGPSSSYPMPATTWKNHGHSSPFIVIPGAGALPGSMDLQEATVSVQNGRHAIRFDHDTAPVLSSASLRDDQSVLLQQPITVMVVADAQGDCTLFDNGFMRDMSRAFEFCHGYPSVGDADRDHPRICMHAGDGVYLRGTTRSSTGWHVYSCIFDGANSELRVDGVLEASGDAGSNGPSGFTVGRYRDMESWPLIGRLSEFRVFDHRLATHQREALEVSLARRYGLPHPALQQDEEEEDERPTAKRQRRAE